MANDGKRLEALVAYAEKTLLPYGFEVRANERVVNDEGIQIAEFDVEARGKVGTTDFAWLIECRDRPTSGPAPASWIEQLVGRRGRFNFNKVTAVSTTGFSAGATEFAAAAGIELREVRSLTPWLEMRYLTNHVRHTTLLGMRALLRDDVSEEQKLALMAVLQVGNGATPILRSSSSGELVTPDFAFCGAVGSNQDLFSDLVPNGEAKRIELHASYTDDDHFIVHTTEGDISLPGIIFVGDLRLKEKIIPLVYTAEYRKLNAEEPISQVVSFAPTSAMGIDFALEMHRLAETGETHVTLRRLPK